MNLSQQIQDKINRETDKIFPLGDFISMKIDREISNKRAGFDAGATLWAERAEKLVKVLEEIYKDGNAGKTVSTTDSHISAKAKKALTEYQNS